MKMRGSMLNVRDARRRHDNGDPGYEMTSPPGAERIGRGIDMTKSSAICPRRLQGHFTFEEAATGYTTFSIKAMGAKIPCC